MKKLDWDTEFFQVNFFELEESDYDNFSNIIEKGLDAPFCIQKLCESENVIEKLKSLGFRVLEEKLTYSAKISELIFPSESIDSIVESTSNLLNSLQVSNEDLFLEGRFHHLETVTKKQANKFYLRWIENVLNKSFETISLSLKHENLEIGYCTLNINDNCARIGLFGILRSYQGKGFGKRLLSGVFSYCAENEIEFIEVSTQGTNEAARGLYQKLGFKLVSNKTWMVLEKA